jgi:hypothetical protein
VKDLRVSPDVASTCGPGRHNPEVGIMDLVVESKDANLKYACDSLAQQKAVRVRADYDMLDADVETQLKAPRALKSARLTIQRVDDDRSNPDQWKDASHNMSFGAFREVHRVAWAMVIIRNALPCRLGSC